MKRYIFSSIVNSQQTIFICDSLEYWIVDSEMSCVYDMYFLQGC